MIEKIRLQNFRNLKDQVVEFGKGVTVIVGPNASGKTNLLESIFLVSTGKSFKANLESELINLDKKFARVKGLVGDNKLEIILAADKHKKFLINGVAKRQIDFASNLKVVLFGPWDMDLVTSSPSLRRKFLDNVLSLTDREYRRSILSYEKGLRQRNKILWDIRDASRNGMTNSLPKDRLLFWDQLLIKNGDYISNLRDEFINFVNETKPINKENLSIEYDRSVISEGRLENYARQEIASATTLVGPHRDDFIFKIGERNLSSFGSRGEQRMAILWLKLAELAFIEKKTNEKPTLLLDDIFSELDEGHREIVFKVSESQQTIITTADPDFLVDKEDITRIQF
jgi:DNA replication and repair protein RecF